MQNITETAETNTPTMLIGFCAGGRRDTAIISKPKTFEQLALLLSTPKVGQKDGSYLLRGGDVRPAFRADENLKKGELIVIDGDSTFDPETGEITPGAPPIDEITAALEDMGITYMIHTSHSARPLEGFWKYRILIPAPLANVDELRACVAAIIAQLHARGVWVAEVDENNRWSQPWYLPRVVDEDAIASFVFRAKVAEPFCVADALAWYANKVRQERKEETLRSAPPISRALRDEESPISAFNSAHGLEWVRSTLESQGYRFGYYDKAQQAYRYTRPGSETKIPGVVVFQGNRGDWCCYSHHGSADPLSSKVTDPFALLAMFQHGGDLRAAVRAIKPPEPTIAERIASREGLAAPERPAAAEPADLSTRNEPFVDESLRKADAKPGKRVISLMPWADLQDVKVKWLVKDMLPANSFVAIYGKSGAGKSFFALYLAAMIASGQEAFGMQTQQGAVVYLALEGAAGLRRRRDALIQTYELPGDLPIQFICAQINLRSSVEDVQAIIDALVEAGVNPALIIIDTLARAFAGGDENAVADAMAFVSLSSVLQDRFQCSVAAIHHSGKDEGRGMRGSSALRAACDAEIEVVRMSADDAEEPFCQAVTTKQKDGMDGLKFPFRMQLVQTSRIDPDATSLVVLPVDAADAPARAGRSPKDEPRALVKARESLVEALSHSDATATHEEIPRGVKVVTESLWREYFMMRSEANNLSAKRTAWGRAKKDLKDANIAGQWGNFFWLIQ